jgi:hypothetical protein
MKMMEEKRCEGIDMYQIGYLSIIYVRRNEETKSLRNEETNKRRGEEKP